MNAEILFLRYAFPCSFILQQRGEITAKEFSQLEEGAINKKVLDRAFLERIYFRAVEKIQVIADEGGKDKWDGDVIKEYFLVRHNQLIDQGMYNYRTAPPVLKELCKVQRATVVAIKGEYLVVSYDGKQRPVSREMVPEAKKGDSVMIHYGYAVETI